MARYTLGLQGSEWDFQDFVEVVKGRPNVLEAHECSRKSDEAGVPSHKSRVCLLRNRNRTHTSVTKSEQAIQSR